MAVEMAAEAAVCVTRDPLDRSAQHESARSEARGKGEEQRLLREIGLVVNAYRAPTVAQRLVGGDEAPEGAEISVVVRPKK